MTTTLAYLLHGGKQPQVKKTTLAALLRVKPAPKSVPLQKFDYSGPLQCACDCNTAPTAVLKAVAGSRVRDYVEPRLKGLKNAVHKVMQTWGKKWAKQLAKGIPNPNKADLAVLLKASTKTVEQILDEIETDGFSVALMDKISKAMREAFKDGGVAAQKMVGLENDAEAMVELMDEDALRFAQSRAAELVGKKEVKGKLVDNPDAKWSVPNTTREGLRKLVSEAVEQGWSAGDLEERILDSFFFSDQRAEMIARTELAFAYVQGNLAGWKATGVVKGKRSILADTHPFEDVCDECEAEGVVLLDEPFKASGSLAPPWHPNCLCDIVPVLDDEM